MTDTLQIVHDTIYVNNNDLLDVVTKVDGFYMNVWTVYTSLVAIIFIGLGIVFPIIMSNRQDKNNKDFIDKIEHKIKESKADYEKYFPLLESAYNEYIRKMKIEADIRKKYDLKPEDKLTAEALAEMLAQGI